MPTTDGTNFWRQDTDQADRPASSLQDQNVANNLRYLRKRDACVAWAPNNTAEIGSLSWSSVFSVLLHIPAGVSTIRVGCVAEIDIDASSPDTTGRLETQPVVTLPSPAGGDRGDKKSHDITGTSLTQIEHSYDLNEELEESVFGNVRLDQQGHIKEQNEVAASIAGDTNNVTDIKNLWFYHEAAHDTTKTEVLRVNENEGGNANQPRGDILQAQNSTHHDGRVLIGRTTGVSGDPNRGYDFIYLPYIRPHFFYIEFEFNGPPDLDDAALTHRIPYAAQHSTFRFARETQKAFNRRRVLNAQTNNADEWATVEPAGSPVGDSGNVVDETMIADRSTDSSEDSRLEIALGLVLVHQIYSYDLETMSVSTDSQGERPETVQQLSEDAGSAEIELDATLEQLGKGEDWSTATQLGSTTEVVRLNAWPSDRSGGFPLLVQFYPNQTNIKSGQMFRADWHLVSPEIISMDVDESSWVIGDPLRLTVDATFNSWTPSDADPDRDDAALICVQASTHWAVQ